MFGNLLCSVAEALALLAVSMQFMSHTGAAAWQGHPLSPFARGQRPWGHLQRSFLPHDAVLGQALAWLKAGRAWMGLLQALGDPAEPLASLAYPTAAWHQDWENVTYPATTAGRVSVQMEGE